MKQLQPGEKLVLRSENIVQCDFRKHCLFCSQAEKYSGKIKDFELIPVRTHEFQKTVKQLCQKRNDEWGKKSQRKDTSTRTLFFLLRGPNVRQKCFCHQWH